MDGSPYLFRITEDIPGEKIVLSRPKLSLLPDIVFNSCILGFGLLSSYVVDQHIFEFVFGKFLYFGFFIATVGTLLFVSLFGHFHLTRISWDGKERVLTVTRETPILCKNAFIPFSSLDSLHLEIEKEKDERGALLCLIFTCREQRGLQRTAQETRIPLSVAGISRTTDAVSLLCRVAHTSAWPVESKSPDHAFRSRHALEWGWYQSSTTSAGKLYLALLRKSDPTGETRPIPPIHESRLSS